MRVRRPWPWLLFVLIAVLMSAALAYAVAEPMLRYYLTPAPEPGELSALRTLSVFEEIRIRAFEVFTFGWVFMFGATVGSFLNVVAYRMPRSESIVWRASHCPYCNQPIRATDNVPIIGWLRLGGRCRTCRLPISPRYPIVELITGVLFTTLAYVELFSGGANLPGRGEASHYYGLTRTILDTRWDLVVIYGYHTLLLSVLLSMVLMRWDDQRVPWRLAITTGLLGLLAAAAWPHVQPVRWDATVLDSVGETLAPMARVLTAVMGLAAGSALGAVATAIANSAVDNRHSSGLFVAVALVGLFLGWQGLAGAVLLALVAGLPLVGLLRLALYAHRVPAMAYLLLGVLIQICFWRHLS